MKVEHLTPILNVSDIQASFEWFSRLGFNAGFSWGEPVGFGSVCSGNCEIFLCEGAQGGRGKGNNTRTFDVEGGEIHDKGVWMSLWVEDMDAAYVTCTEQQIEITLPPTSMPWNVREMHIRHPDGHVFRISKGMN